MSKQKSISQLEAERAACERQLTQLQHKVQQYKNRIAYCEKGERRKRTHRLIAHGAAVESVAPTVKTLTEVEFYAFTESVFALSEVPTLLAEAILTQIKRSAGQSVVAAAACCPGEKLHSEYYGEDSDYTRKGGVACSEILLPAHAPPEYADREILWDAVENVERGKKAQLAYSFDIALQNAFSMEENSNLARQFLLEQFVSRGMIVDFAVHSPDKEDGGFSNPHLSHPSHPSKRQVGQQAAAGICAGRGRKPHPGRNRGLCVQSRPHHRLGQSQSPGFAFPAASLF